MLHAVASRHPAGVTKPQLGVLAGYASGGGTFRTYLPRLIREGLVEVSSHDGTIHLTRLGENNVPSDVLSRAFEGAAVRDMWMRSLKGGVLKMFKVIVERYPDPISKEDLGRLTYEHTGGTFRTYLPKLKRLGLVTIEGADVRASDHLFDLTADLRRP
jgi:hypothetical protein